MSGRYGEVQEWMRRFVASPAPQECIWWPFNTSAGGYAVAWNPRTKRQAPAYRVIWEFGHGAVFPAPEACHSCGNGALGCVNWEHIDPGTHQDNMRDRTEDGRDVVGSDHGRAKIHEADVAEICELLTQGQTIRKVAADFGLSDTVVGDIWHGKRWTHVNVPRLADMERTCVECGDPLTGSHAGKRYCGITCLNRAGGRRRNRRRWDAEAANA
jgi:hypothetical protein